VREISRTSIGTRSQPIKGTATPQKTDPVLNGRSNFRGLKGKVRVMGLVAYVDRVTMLQWGRTDVGLPWVGDSRRPVKSEEGTLEGNYGE